MPDIVVLGDIMVDLIAHIERYPEPGGDGICPQIATRGGGSAANTAKVLARLGLNTALIGRIGHGAFAQYALERLNNTGVDTSQIQRDETISTGMMFIPVTPDGQRTMFGSRGANVLTAAQDIDAQIIRSARWLHISGYAFLNSPQREAALYALKEAKIGGAQISLDPGLEIVRQEADLIRQLLPDLSLLLPNRAELVTLTQATTVANGLWTASKWGIETVALKLGAEGSRLGQTKIPAFDIDVVDTTGAGDAFAAGFIAAKMSGLGLSECGLLANALGALATSVEGSLDVDLAQVIDFLNMQAKRSRWADWQTEFKNILGWISRL